MFWTIIHTFQKAWGVEDPAAQTSPAFLENHPQHPPAKRQSEVSTYVYRKILRQLNSQPLLQVVTFLCPSMREGTEMQLLPTSKRQFYFFWLPVTSHKAPKVPNNWANVYHRKQSGVNSTTAPGDWWQSAAKRAGRPALPTLSAIRSLPRLDCAAQATSWTCQRLPWVWCIHMYLLKQSMDMDIQV